MEQHEIEKRDLRSACIHEAAHAVIANYVQVPAEARVFRTDTQDAGEEKTWVGQTKFYIKMDGVGEHKRRMIALAGTVAEQFADDANVSAMELFEWLEDGFILDLSPTDAELAGAYTEKDIDDCLGLVRQLWDDILFKAEWLAKVELL